MAKDSETTYTSGSGTTSINASNPLATQQITDDVYKALNGYTYRPTNISMLDDIRLDPWDTIEVTHLDGNVYIVPAMILEHSFTNCETRISAVGKTEVENEYSYSGPITTALERTATELLVANRIIATKVDAEWVQANTITADKLDATNARIGELETNSITAAEADLKYANITLGNIDTANINKANIGSLFAEVGLLTSATIMNGHVTGYLDSVEVNENNITAGTLITDRLVFRGQEKSIVYELNNITGALQSVQSDTLNGEILTDRSITVDKIVAKSITANEIATATLTANELNVANIFGNSAVLKTLTSQSAFIDAISTNSIVVGANNAADLAKKMANGKLLFNDPTFISGNNEVLAYDRTTNRDVTTISRVAKTSYNMTSCPTTSNYIMQIKTVGASAPGLGGFVQSFRSRANAVFIVKYSINLPTGYYLRAISNSMGSEFTDEFIGDTEGTGTWKEYYRMIKCGTTGSFSTGGYVYVEGNVTPTISSPLVWYLGAIYAYDVTDANPINSWIHQNTTLIDGGKIYTGTVTADKLSVNSLSAISANLGTVKIGGSGNGNGVLEIYDATNKLLIKGDNAGLATTKMINVNDNSQSIVFSKTAYSYGGAMYSLSGIKIGNLDLGEGSDYYTEQIDGGYIGGLSKIFAGNTFDIMMGNSRYNIKSILTGYYGAPDNGGIAPVKAQFNGDVNAEKISTSSLEANKAYLTSIEISGPTPYIDFNFNNSAIDYTSRIIENSSGTLTVTGNLTVNNTLRCNKALELYAATPFIDFHYGNSTADYTARIIESSSGALKVYNSISNASDRRLKKDIVELSEKYLDVLDNLKPMEYRYIKGDKYLNLGFVAQDVLEALEMADITDIPLVSVDYSNGMYSLDYNGLIPILVLAVQKLRREIEELRIAK